MQKLQNISRVAVIGAGPAGVAAAKYLLAEKAFTCIDVFEQRSTCGGVWNYTPENDRDGDFTVPQTRPSSSCEQPIWREGNGISLTKEPARSHPTFISPLYERLEANLPKMLMQHSDTPFPEESQLFPTHATIAEYLERYADDVRHLIQFETQVLQVRPLRSEGKTTWSVTTQNLVSHEQTTADYDAVAVANGHYTVPFIPDIPGVREWNEQYPGSISHSKFYREPEEFSNKKVLTIGVGYSGLDIASQIEPLCHPPLLVSARTQPNPTPTTPTRLTLPAITSFNPSARSITFSNTHTEPAIDRIIFCTGYLYSYPFLHLSPPTPPLLTDGSRTRSLYRHIFASALPSLAFLALPQKVVPFPVSESQAAVITRVWSGRLALPSAEEMRAWEEEVVREKGDDKRFHYMSPPEDGRYVNELHEWAMGVEPRGMGKEPPFWGEKELWVRERILGIKEAFVALGEGRRGVRRLEELGFDFEEWKRGRGDRMNGEVGGETEEEGGRRRGRRDSAQEVGL